MTPAGTAGITKNVRVYYGQRGTAFCRPCADQRTKLDKKPLSRKDPGRRCSGCGLPIRARQLPL